MYRCPAHKKTIHTMKKFLLISILFCITSLADAQKKTQIYLLANGGMNYATYYQSSTATDNLGGVWGPDGGISVRTVTPTWWGVEGGLNYSTKGADFPDSTGKVTFSYVGAFF